MPSTASMTKGDQAVKMSLVDELSFCVVRMECKKRSGKTSVGTGFFYNFTLSDDQNVPAIVTNRHVVEGAIDCIFHFSEEGENETPLHGKIATVRVQNPGAGIIGHPDPEVDLCVLPLAVVLRHFEDSGKKLFYKFIDKSFIPSPDEFSKLTALQEVVMIGYPVGLWDSVNNMPFFRKGIAATHPHDDFQGRKEFFIDAAVFKGSSGSPVFRWGAIIEDRNTILIGGVQIGLIGILRGVVEWPAKGEIRVVPVPTDLTAIPVTNIPTNLGCVIKAQRLLEFAPVLEGIAANTAGRPGPDGASET